MGLQNRPDRVLWQTRLRRPDIEAIFGDGLAGKLWPAFCAAKRSTFTRCRSGWDRLSLVVSRAEFVALNASHLYNGFEATVEHSLAIEWHALRVAHLVNARVSHDFFVHTVAMRA